MSGIGRLCIGLCLPERINQILRSAIGKSKFPAGRQYTSSADEGMSAENSGRWRRLDPQYVKINMNDMLIALLVCHETPKASKIISSWPHPPQLLAISNDVTKETISH